MAKFSRRFVSRRWWHFGPRFRHKGRDYDAPQSQNRSKKPPGPAELRATLALAGRSSSRTSPRTALITSRRHPDGLAWSEALAAGALGTNLYFALLIFGIGLMSATAPLIAEELGPASAIPSARSGARSARASGPRSRSPFRSGSSPGTARRILLATGQEPALAKVAAEYIRRAAMEPAAVPALSGPALVPRGSGAARLGPGHRPAAPPGQFRRRLLPDVRQLRPAGPRARRRGLGTVIRAPSCSSRSRLSSSATRAAPLSPLRALLAGRLAALPHPLAHRRADRADDRLRGDGLQRRRPADGPDRRRRTGRACDRPADRVLQLHGSASGSARR